MAIIITDKDTASAALRQAASRYLRDAAHIIETELKPIEACTSATTGMGLVQALVDRVHAAEEAADLAKATRGRRDAPRASAAKRGRNRGK